MERMLKDEKEKQEQMNKFRDINMKLIGATSGFYILFGLCYLLIDDSPPIFGMKSTTVGKHELKTEAIIWIEIQLMMLPVFLLYVLNQWIQHKLRVRLMKNKLEAAFK